MFVDDLLNPPPFFSGNIKVGRLAWIKITLDNIRSQLSHHGQTTKESAPPAKAFQLFTRQDVRDTPRNIRLSLMVAQSEHFLSNISLTGDCQCKRKMSQRAIRFPKCRLECSDLDFSVQIGHCLVINEDKNYVTPNQAISISCQ